MNAGIEKELNPGANAPEEVMDGTPEITEDNLFDLVNSGAITLDDANEWIHAQEKSVPDGEPNGHASNAAPDSADEGNDEEVGVVSENNNEPPEGGVVPDVKPFRVYNTQEEFQRDFDRSWNQRYGKQKEEAERKDREYNALLSDVAELLGVEPESAAAELRKRKLTSAAQREGKNPDEYIETETLRAENARLKESEEKRKAAEMFADINAQGAKIKQADPAFDINEAMKNPEFARQVFFTRQTNPERAVEIAYKIYYGDKALAASAPVNSAPVQKRPQEGAAKAVTTGAKRPVDFSKMTDDEIRTIEKRLMSGERVIF